MSRNVWGGVIVGLIVLASLLVGAPMLWRAGGTLGQMAEVAILGSTIVKGAVVYLVPLLVTILGFICLGLLIAFGVRTIVAAVSSIGKQISDLSRSLSRDAKQAGIDAGFMGAIALLSAVVAYMATNDFLDEVSTLKILAASGIGYAVFKAFMLIPIRPVQILAGALTIALLAGSMYLVFSRHHLLGMEDLKIMGARFRELEPTKKITLVFAFLLSAASLLYPFTRSGWKEKILRLREQ